jgi:hypothetical protein
MPWVHITMGDINMMYHLQEYVTLGVSKFLPVKNVEARSYKGTQIVNLRSLRDLSLQLDQAVGGQGKYFDDCHSREVEDSRVEMSWSPGASKSRTN